MYDRNKVLIGLAVFVVAMTYPFWNNIGSAAYSFTPLPGCFSPFPHGTRPLSVTGEYLGLEGGPPSFPPGFTCPAVLRHRSAVPAGSRTGL